MRATGMDGKGRHWLWTPKFLQVLLGVQWSISTALWGPKGPHCRVRGGYLLHEARSFASCKAYGHPLLLWPQVETW